MRSKTLSKAASFLMICCASMATGLPGCSSTSGGWQLQHSATAGSAIATRRGGKEIRIACRLNPADLYVAVSGISPSPDLRNLEVRSGGHAALLPLLEAPYSTDVQASGPVPTPFLYMLNGTSPFKIIVAGRTFTLASLDKATREAFAIACGKAAGTWAPPVPTR